MKSFCKNKYNILVTAVGAIVGYGIIESLRLSGYDLNIIGCDIFDDAVGRYFADDFIIAEPAASGHYIDFLKKTIDEKHVDLVLFGIEQEIDAVSNNRVVLGDYLDKLVVDSKDIIDISNDKWLTGKWLAENDLREYSIDSASEGEYEDIRKLFGEPFLIKPRVSRAGKGIVAIQTKEDFDYHKKKLGGNFMAQRIVSDEENEYTAGVFADGSGKILNSICLRRKLSQEGATAKAWVVDDPALEIACQRITKALKPTGPVNYQFRKDKNSVFLLEVNPRISSSVSIRSKMGYNEAEMCIDYFLENRLPEKSVIKNGKALRYIADWIIEE